MDSMAMAVEVADKRALCDHLNETLEKWFIHIEPDDIKSEPYGYCHIVLMKNQQQAVDDGGQWYFGNMGADYWGAVGYTDVPIG